MGMSQPQPLRPPVSQPPAFQSPLSRQQAIRAQASLSSTLVRRRPLLFTPPTPAATRLPAVYSARRAAWANWGEDLRFFLTCYAAGLAFFLIMLS